MHTSQYDSKTRRAIKRFQRTSFYNDMKNANKGEILRLEKALETVKKDHSLECQVLKQQIEALAKALLAKGLSAAEISKITA